MSIKPVIANGADRKIKGAKMTPKIGGGLKSYIRTKAPAIVDSKPVTNMKRLFLTFFCIGF